MNRILLAFLLAVAVLGQTPPSTLQVVRLFNLGDASVAANVLDNRSTTIRRSDTHSFCATGTGTWSMTIQFSDTSATGPWTSFGAAGVVNQASANCIGFGYGYHSWISFSVTGSATATYTGWKQMYIPAASGSVSVLFPITVSQGGTNASSLTANGVILGNGTSTVQVTAAGTADQVLRVPGAGGTPAFGALDLATSGATTGLLGPTKGGTGSNLTATLGRYPRADGTVFGLSSVAAAGAGTCTNQFVRANVDNAVPTCASVAGTDFATQTANLVFSGPSSGGAATPTFRSLVKADLLATTVFTDQANTFTAGMKQTLAPSASTAGIRITAGALPSTPATGDLAIDSAASNTFKWYNGSTWSQAASGTVTSIGVAVPTEFSVSGSPVTTSGTITISKATQANNLVYAGPLSGGPTAPTFRAIAKSDLPSVTLYSDAGATISTGTWDFTAATSTRPVKVGASDPATCAQGELFFNTTAVALKVCGTTNNWSSYAPASPSVTISNASVTGTTTSTLTKLTGAPSTAVIAATTDTAGVIGITTAGAGTTGSATITTGGIVACVFDGATTAGHYVILSSSVAGNCRNSGATLPATGQIVGRVLTTNGGAGTYNIELFGPEIRGALLQLTLTMPAEFSVAGSPATGTGSITVTKATQSANLVYAGPSSGGAAVPTFRATVKADLPATTMYTDQANVVTVAGGLTMDNQLGLRLREATAGGTNYAEFRAAAAMAANVTWTLPDSDSAGAFRSDGAGAVTITSASGVGTCSNQFVTALTNNAAPTCTTATLASAQFANQGTTTTVLHGNAAGNPSFGAVALTTDVSGILPGANGGTANGFFAVSGPATSLKTFTFPNASATVLTDNAAVAVAQGGTGVATLAVNGVLLGNTTSPVQVTAAGAADTILRVPGGGGAPAFGSIDLSKAAAVGTSILPVANGGSGVATIVSRERTFCSGTATSSATLILTVWNSGACTNTTEGVAQEILVNSAGTIRNLRVKAGTAGFAAGSGVVTIRKNAADTIVTCTLGVGTTCGDTVNSATVAAGDRITVKVVTVATETVADINVAFEF